MKAYCIKCMKERPIYDRHVKIVGTVIHIIGKDKSNHKITRVFILE